MSTGIPSSANPTNELTELFYLMACKNGYLTETQCTILKGISKNNLGLEGLLNLISLWNVGVKCHPQILSLIRELQAMSPDEVKEKLRMTQEAPPQLINPISRELEWFCYLAIREKLLTEIQCLEMDAELQHKRDFLSFAQAVVFVLPKEKFARIQELVEKSMEYANTGRAPPSRIFEATLNM